MKDCRLLDGDPILESHGHTLASQHNGGQGSETGSDAQINDSAMSMQITFCLSTGDC